jgi:hypothetical protein
VGGSADNYEGQKQFRKNIGGDAARRKGVLKADYMLSVGCLLGGSCEQHCCASWRSPFVFSLAKLNVSGQMMHRLFRKTLQSQVRVECGEIVGNPCTTC